MKEKNVMKKNLNKTNIISEKFYSISNTSSDSESFNSTSGKNRTNNKKVKNKTKNKYSKKNDKKVIKNKKNEDEEFNSKIKKTKELLIIYEDEIKNQM